MISAALIEAYTLTSTQLQRLLDKHGLSQRRTAKAIGIDERTMRRYIAGEKPTPRAIELAIRYLTEHPEELSKEDA